MTCSCVTRHAQIVRALLVSQWLWLLLQSGKYGKCQRTRKRLSKERSTTTGQAYNVNQAELTARRGFEPMAICGHVSCQSCLHVAFQMLSCDMSRCFSCVAFHVDVMWHVMLLTCCFLCVAWLVILWLCGMSCCFSYDTNI